MMPNNTEPKKTSYNAGHEKFISMMQDLYDRANRQGRSIMTSFLSLPQQKVLRSTIKDKTAVTLYGGYDNAQRKVACFFGQDDNFHIVCLRCINHDGITHRDVLGSLMNLGLERDVIGDILFDDEFIYVFVLEHLAYYIIESCTKIKQVSIQFSVYSSNAYPSIEVKEIQINCASLRMDAIVAALSHCSRSEAMKKIRSGLVKVDDLVLEQNQQICNNSYVSIHRCGKFYFDSIKAKTRKDRLVLKFYQFV